VTVTSNHVVPLDGSLALGREVVGNKGASIGAMLALGLPVPPAFALPIDECRRYHAAGGVLADDVWEAVLGSIASLERETGRRLGDPEESLLVSVRSGAAVSMPGMMDTILNLGMTDEVEAGMGRRARDSEFARATHVRFCHEFGHTVLGADLDPPGAGATARDVRAAVLADTGHAVPEEPLEQLRAAIKAVFGSWSSRRAIAYRKHWGIPEDGGTAVIVQAMVFGNLAERSGTGVLFTRDPLTGEPEPYGEWLPGGQGEDVVSGTHDCLELAALKDAMPDVGERLVDAGRLLEQTNGDVQDIEFTVERGRLYLLQTRAAKRSPLAAVRIAVDLATEGAIARDVALQRVSVDQLALVLAPRLPAAVAETAEVLARGTPACPGVASGRVVHDSDAAEAAAGDVVLVRPTTSPDDVAGMIAATAIVTERGGSTSHAAVVSRALGRPSVVGVGAGVTAAFGDREITVDGSAGVVYAGALDTEAVEVADVPRLEDLVAWAREISPVEVLDHAPEVVDVQPIGVGLAEGAPADPDLLAEQLRGAPAARGALLATAEGAEAVLRSGVPTVVRTADQHAATLLLRLVQARSPSEEKR